jgi:hypothetical protein
MPRRPLHRRAVPQGISHHLHLPLNRADRPLNDTITATATYKDGLGDESPTLSCRMISADRIRHGGDRKLLVALNDRVELCQANILPHDEQQLCPRF